MKKNLIISLLLLFAVNINAYEWGLNFRYGLIQDRADFRNFPNVPNCCPAFETGSGIGYSAGLFYNFRLSNRFLFGFNFGIQTYNSTLIREENTVLTGNIPAIIEHRVNPIIMEAYAKPTLSYRLFSEFYLSGAFHYGYLLSGEFSQVEQIVDPLNTTFETGSSTRNELNNQEIENLMMDRYAIEFGLTYNLPLNKRKSFLIAPEINYQYGLTNIVNERDWTYDMLSFGISIKKRKGIELGVPTSFDINILKVEVGSEKDSTIASFISNIGKGQLEVDEIYLDGDDKDFFSIVNGARGFTLNPNRSKPTEIRFSPTEVRNYDANIIIETDNGRLKQKITGSGITLGTEYVNNMIDFGPVEIGNRKDTLLVKTIQNIGSEPLRILDAKFSSSSSSDFSILSNLYKETIAPDKIFEMDVRFNPSQTVRINGILEIYHDGKDSPAKIRVSGEGFKEEIPTTVSLSAFGLDNNGNEFPLSNVSIEEILRFRVVPLLPFVFFKEGQSEIPEKYRKLNYTEANKFTENSFVSDSTLEIYYNVLNIIGKRLSDNSTSSITIVGTNSNSDLEKNNKELSRKRAESVKSYFINTWDISESQISIETRNLPAAPSNKKSLEGKEENRRVEIKSEYPKILDIIKLNDTLRTVYPPKLRFVPGSNINPYLWDFDVKQKYLTLNSRRGTGRLPSIIDWDIQNDQKNVPRLQENTTANLKIQDDEGERFTESKIIETRITRIDNRKISEFDLILFSYNSSEVEGKNSEIIELVASYIRSNSKVEIIGYTDNTGDPKLNEKLSIERAESARDKLITALDFELKKENLKVTGVGEDNNLFPFEKPEGRMYSRTVKIKIDTPIED